MGSIGLEHFTKLNFKALGRTFHSPMLRHVPQPLNSAGFVFRIRLGVHAVTSLSISMISFSRSLISASMVSSGRGGS